MYYLSISLFFFLIAQITQTRSISERITSTTLRRKQGWIFLTRMILNQGTINIKSKILLTTKNKLQDRKYQFDLLIISDQIWPIFETNKQKKEELIEKEYIHQIPMIMMSNKGQVQIDTYFHQNKQTAYHFVLTDCKKNLINQYFNKKSHLDCNLSVDNADSYLSASDYYLSMFCLCMIINAVVQFMFLRTSVEFGQTDYLKIFTCVCIIQRIIALSNLYIFYKIQQWGGSLWPIFQCLYLFFTQAAQSTFLAILIFLSYGWLTAYTSSKNHQFALPLISLFIFINAILSLLTKVTDNEQKYHIYDSIISYFIIVIRGIGFIIFSIGIVRGIWKKQKRRSRKDIEQYYQKLAKLGFICFFILPFLIVMIENVNRCERNSKIIMCLEMVRNLYLNVIASSIVGKNNIYKKVTLVNRSFMQNDSNKLL